MAAASRAHISRLIYDLSGHAADRACGRATHALIDLDRDLGLRPGFEHELRRPLREHTQLGLHSLLHRFLDEGRRLSIQDVEGLADEALQGAAAGLLVERSEELCASLGLPDEAQALDAVEWEEALREALEAADARSCLDASVRKRLRRAEVLRDVPIAA